MDRSKAGVARRLADAHYRLDRHLHRVIRLLGPDEDAPAEPVKLLEVNADTAMAGIMPIRFGADAGHGIFYPSVIVELHPDEFAKVESSAVALPHGWTLGDDLPRREDEMESE